MPFGFKPSVVGRPFSRASTRPRRGLGGTDVRGPVAAFLSSRCLEPARPVARRLTAAAALSRKSLERRQAVSRKVGYGPGRGAVSRPVEANASHGTLAERLRKDEAFHPVNAAIAMRLGPVATRPGTLAVPVLIMARVMAGALSGDSGRGRRQRSRGGRRARNTSCLALSPTGLSAPDADSRRSRCPGRRAGKWEVDRK